MATLYFTALAFASSRARSNGYTTQQENTSSVCVEVTSWTILEIPLTGFLMESVRMWMSIKSKSCAPARFSCTKTKTIKIAIAVQISYISTVRGLLQLASLAALLTNSVTTAAPAPPMASATAMERLRQSVNLEEIIELIKIVAADPDVHPQLLAYLNGPNRMPAIYSAWGSAPGQTSVAQDAPLKERAWLRYTSSLPNDLGQWLGARDDPGAFLIVQNLTDSPALPELGISLLQYARAIEGNTPKEAAFFEFLRDRLFYTYTVSYYNEAGEFLFNGSMNRRTEEFRPALTPSDKAQLGIVKETLRLSYNSDISVLVKWNTDQGYKFLEEAISGVPPTTNWLNQLTDSLATVRYDRRVIPLFHRTMQRASAQTAGVVTWYFLTDIINSESYPPALESANPDTYPQILAFLLDAEKIDIQPPFKKLVAERKAALLQLMAQHKIPPVPAPLPVLDVANPIWSYRTPSAAADTPAPSPVAAMSPESATADHATPYSAAAIVLALLGLLVFLARRKV